MTYHVDNRKVGSRTDKAFHDFGMVLFGSQHYGCYSELENGRENYARFQIKKDARIVRVVQDD